VKLVKVSTMIALSLLSLKSFADANEEVLAVARANNLNPSQRVVTAIVNASTQYDISASELTAIAIIETRLGKNIKVRHNTNGTEDKGLFQINTINHSKCIEYNLNTPEGSALCAAKLLHTIKQKRDDYLGVYHSKTPSKKHTYMKQIDQILAAR